MKSEVEVLTERVLFLERVLRQACLTHGGRLVIDPSTYEEACRLGGSLVFGRFLDNSGWFGVSLLTEQEVREWTR